MARASSIPISPNFSPSEPIRRMVRELISSLTRGPSLDGGVGCENFLIAMAISFQKAQREAARGSLRPPRRGFHVDCAGYLRMRARSGPVGSLRTNTEAV